MKIFQLAPEKFDEFYPLVESMIEEAELSLIHI